MSNSTDDFFAARSHLNAVASSLRGLSRALSRVGNDKLSDELHIYADNIEDATTTLTTWFDARLNADLAAAREGTAETLRFALAYAGRNEKGE